MKIEQSQKGTVTLVSVQGAIMLSESGLLFSNSLKEVLDNKEGSVLVDLSGVDEVDSTGLGELVGYMQKFSQDGRRLAILNPSPKISKLFEFVNLHKVLHIFTDLEEAVAALTHHKFAQHK
jgi:anti-anti-sigma factor